MVKKIILSIDDSIYEDSGDDEDSGDEDNVNKVLKVNKNVYDSITYHKNKI